MWSVVAKLPELQRLLTEPDVAAQSVALEQHLEQCAECRAYLELASQLGDLLPDAPTASSMRYAPTAALSTAMRHLE